MGSVKGILVPYIVLWLLISGSSHAQEVYIDPSEVDSVVGASFAVDVMVRNVADLSAFEFYVSFDKDILEALSVSRGSLWNDPNYLWHAGKIDNTSGMIDFTSGAASSGLAPIGVNVGADGDVLAVIAFRAIAAGISPVDLIDAIMFDVNGAAIGINAANGNVQIAPLGDVNNDGKVQSKDAILALRIAAGLMEPTEYERLAADMNSDSKIGSEDAIRILREAGGLAAPGKDYIVSIGGPITITLCEAHGVSGQTIKVPVRVDHIRGLVGGDICIAYDPAVLRVVGVSSNSDMLLANNIAEPGMVRISFAVPDRLNSGTLVGIRFNILADNASPLTLKSVELCNPDALPIDLRKLDGKFTSWARPLEHSALLQNFPNPFNPDTWVPYQLKEGGEVAIRIFSVPGDLVRELKLGYKPAGFYVSRDRAAYWDGKNEQGEEVASGVYFYSIQAGDLYAVRKLIVLK